MVVNVTVWVRVGCGRGGGGLPSYIDGEGGIWHLTDGEGLSWLEFGRRIANALDLDADLVTAPSPEELVGRHRARICALASQAGSCFPR